jgi:hypothetical protein
MAFTAFSKYLRLGFCTILLASLANAVALDITDASKDGFDKNNEVQL